MSEAEHSVYGGSVAARYLNCAGSVKLAESVPPRPETSYAREGTIAHTLGAHCLRTGERLARNYEGATLDINPPDYPPFSAEMCDAVQSYLDAVYVELDADPLGEIYIEERFTLDVPSAPGEVFGTGDALVYQPTRKRLAVFDYKHGAGVAVAVDNNAQAKFYGAGAAFAHPEWPIDEVELFIVQPRSISALVNGPVASWSMDPVDLLEFMEELDAGIALTKTDAPPFKPGKWCRFCPASGVCMAAQETALVEAGLHYTDVSVITPKLLPAPRTLDVDRIGRALHAMDILEAWGNSLRDFATGLLEQGIPVPGWKLVDKAGRRKWHGSEEEIAAWLMLTHDLTEDDVTPRELRTITEIEKVVLSKFSTKAEKKAAKDEFSLKCTIKDSSGRTIAPASDAREAVNAIATDYASVSLPAAH